MVDCRKTGRLHWAGPVLRPKSGEQGSPLAGRGEAGAVGRGRQASASVGRRQDLGDAFHGTPTDGGPPSTAPQPRRQRGICQGRPSPGCSSSRCAVLATGFAFLPELTSVAPLLGRQSVTGPSMPVLGVARNIWPGRPAPPRRQGKVRIREGSPGTAPSGSCHPERPRSLGPPPPGSRAQRG